MLVQLLERVARGGSVHLGELADEFGLTAAVVRDMLADLAIRGYLRPTGGDCSTKCGGCAFATSCHGETETQTWMLTEKGRSLASSGAA